MCQTQPGRGLQLLLIGELIEVCISVLGLFGGSGGILSLVSLVLVLMGLYQLRPSQENYGKAFVWSFLAFAVAVVSAILVVIAALLPILLIVVLPLVAVAGAVVEYLIFYYTCAGTGALLSLAGDRENALLADQVSKLYLLTTAVTVVCKILAMIPILGFIFKLLGALSGLAGLVGSALLVYFLHKAMKQFT